MLVDRALSGSVSIVVGVKRALSMPPHGGQEFDPHEALREAIRPNASAETQELGIGIDQVAR